MSNAPVPTLFSRPTTTPSVPPGSDLFAGSAALRMERATPRSTLPPHLRSAISANPQSAALIPLRHTASLLDPSYATAKPMVAFGQTAALRAGWEMRQQQTPIIDGTMPLAAPVVVGSAKEPAQTAQRDAVLLTDLDTAEAPAAAAAPAAKPVVVAKLEDNAEDIPLPRPRPSFSPLVNAPSLQSGGRRVASAPPVAPAAPTAPSKPGFFERLFSRPAQPGTAMAYAPSDGGSGGFSGFLSGRANTNYDQSTAIYDILGIEEEEEDVDEFVVFEGNPLQINSQSRAVADGRGSVSVWS